MLDLIALRLLSVEPTTADDFVGNYPTGLTITSSDLSYKHPTPMEGGLVAENKLRPAQCSSDYMQIHISL